MSINDTFIVIPLFPLLILFYFVMRDYMTWTLLALVMAFLGWAYDARLIRSVMMSLKTREFTRTGVFSPERSSPRRGGVQGAGSGLAAGGSLGRRQGRAEHQRRAVMARARADMRGVISRLLPSIRH